MPCKSVAKIKFQGKYRIEKMEKSVHFQPVIDSQIDKSIT